MMCLQFLKSLSFKQRLYTCCLLLGILFLLALDIADDIENGASMVHEIIESLVAIVSFIAVSIFLPRYFRQKKTIQQIQNDLSTAQSELESYKKESDYLAKGLNTKILLQLDDWKLTKTEKEVALLILRGLSNKAIADIRKTSEKTIRQQATAIYQKSNLAGRNELIAFFLEDIISPSSNAADRS